MDSNNATALHKISVMVDEVDQGATATVNFVEQYGWYVLISVLGCFALCILSACYGYCKSIKQCCCDVCWCLTCCCRGHRQKHSRFHDEV